MPRQLPPLRALRAFEAAARHNSFKRAAEELRVTAAAVSQQVKAMEDWLGFRLFHRLHNALLLTEKGEAFLPRVSRVLDDVSSAVEFVRGFDSASIITIGARPNFGTRWLMPRLHRFQEAHPGIEVRLYIGSRFPDLTHAGYDVAIVSGDEPVPERGDYLISPPLLPVCSPALLRRHRLRRPADLADCPLIHMIDSMEDWSQWLQAAGVRGVRGDAGPKFDSYALTLEAAVLGWGVAMARDAFVERDLAEGRLVAPFDLELPATKSWYLVSRPEAQETKIAAFRHWILAEAAAYRSRGRDDGTARRRRQDPA